MDERLRVILKINQGLSLVWFNVCPSSFFVYESNRLIHGHILTSNQIRSYKSRSTTMAVFAVNVARQLVINEKL